MISTAAVAEAGKVSKQRGPKRAAGWAPGCLEQEPWLPAEKGLGSPTWQACRGKELSAEEISGALGVTWKEGKCRLRLAWLKAPLVEKH